MKVLITGATGLVGSKITALYHNQGIHVNYLTTSKEKIVSEKNYQGFLWNPNAGELDLNCFDGVSAIINLAGASISKRWTPAYKEKILSSRLNSLSTLKKGIESIDSNQIKAFVSASAIGIYPHSQSAYYEEDESAIDDSFLGEVVVAWEKQIDSFNIFEFPIANVRVGLVLSKDGGALPEMAKPIKYGAGAAFGSGEQWQSWIHITDLARIFLYAIAHKLEGTFNGVGPNPVTNSKLIKEIAHTLNRPLFLPNVPRIAMQTVLGDMSYLLFASHRVSSKKIEEEGFIFEHTNVGPALKHIYGTSDSRKSTDTVYS